MKSTDKVKLQKSPNIPDILPETDINNDQLANLLQAAFIQWERLENGALMVDDTGIKIIINSTKNAVMTENKVISMFGIWNTRDSVSLENKLVWINQLNRKYSLLGFSLIYADDNIPVDRLLIEYQIRYNGGLIPVQFISILRFVGIIARNILFENNQVQILGTG